jgi:fatty-acyl-CoA synthase
MTPGETKVPEAVAPRFAVRSETCTIADLCLGGVERWPDRDSLVFGETRLTYRELADASFRMARGLRGLGIGRGDHVGVLMTNMEHHPVILIACSLLGAVAVPLNARYRRQELQHTVADADLACLITTDAVDDYVDFTARLLDAFPDIARADDPLALDLEGAPRLRWVLLMGLKQVDGFLPEARWAAATEAVGDEEIEAAARLVGLTDPVVLCYTSGTTSLPKACVLSSESIVRNWRSCSRRMGLVEGDRTFDPLPHFHLGGPGPMLMTLELGGTFISMPHFDPAEAIRTIRREQPTVFWTGFPPIALPIITHPDLESSDLASVRTSYCVAPTDVLKQIQGALPNGRLMTSYGMTESGGAITWSDVTDPLDLRLETNGTVVEGLEMMVAAEDGGDATEDGDGLGEIRYRGPLVFDGYYNDAARTAEVIDEDGWVHSGDLGAIRSDGRLLYRGRMKEMLKVGGENVSPIEIESVLSTHPTVHLVAVVPKPDERYDQVPMAFIELLPGAEVDAEELTTFCAERLASFKVPKAYRFVEEWPMSPGGTKIQKHVLREQVEARG